MLKSSGPILYLKFEQLDQTRQNFQFSEQRKKNSWQMVTKNNFMQHHLGCRKLQKHGANLTPNVLHLCSIFENFDNSSFCITFRVTNCFSLRTRGVTYVGKATSVRRTCNIGPPRCRKRVTTTLNMLASLIMVRQLYLHKFYTKHVFPHLF